jgi:hypothetical protein
MRLQYGLAAYRRDASGLPEMRVVNQYVEAQPAAGGLPVLLARPGLALQRNNTVLPVSGLFQQDGCVGGRLASVSDALRLDGVPIGAVSGSDRVRWAAGEGELLFCRGGRIWRTEGTTVAAVTLPDDFYAVDIGFLRSRFIAVQQGTGRIYWSEELDGTDWPALNFATAERMSDPLIGLQVVGDFLWLMGGEGAEVWAPTADDDLPFAPIDGRVLSKGCAARDTIQLADNSPVWVTHDGVVVRGGDVPLRISTHAIEERIAATPFSALSAVVLPWRGHVFYVLKTAQGSLAYDFATGEWSEWSSIGRNNWRVDCAAQVGADVFVGDDASGRIWKLSDDTATDDGTEIQRIFTALAPMPAGVLPCHDLRLQASTGRAPISVNPVIEVRASRDGGFTWGAWRQASLGTAGEYRTRAAWRRLGLIDAPGMVFEFRLTDATPWRVSGVAINEPFGGRGR